MATKYSTVREAQQALITENQTYNRQKSAVERDTSLSPDDRRRQIDQLARAHRDRADWARQDIKTARSLERATKLSAARSLQRFVSAGSDANAVHDAYQRALERARVIGVFERNGLRTELQAARSRGSQLDVQALLEVAWERGQRKLVVEYGDRLWHERTSVEEQFGDATSLEQCFATQVALSDA